MLIIYTRVCIQKYFYRGFPPFYYLITANKMELFEIISRMLNSLLGRHYQEIKQIANFKSKSAKCSRYQENIRAPVRLQTLISKVYFKWSCLGLNICREYMGMFSTRLSFRIWINIFRIWIETGINPGLWLVILTYPGPLIGQCGPWVRPV